MQTILIYSAKAIIYSVIFFGYYCLALRNKRFHYYNRFYLLTAVALSLLLPLLHIELWHWQSNNLQVIQLFDVIKVSSFETTVSSQVMPFQWNNVPLWIYAAITLYLLLTLGFSILAIFKLRRNYKVEKIEEINFINTDLEQAPFSFFNNLFWKTSLDMNTGSGRQIFKHELTHIRQKHSWDKLFLRIITALFWFNPIYWLAQQELALLHEFIADEKAIEDKSAEAFALMILQSQFTKNIFSPAQSFHYSPIKRRLRMLTTSSNISYNYARRIMVLPLIAITVLFFAFRLKDDKTNDGFIHANAPFVLVVDAGHGGTDNGAIAANGLLEKDINLSIAKKIEYLAPEYGITVKMVRTRDVTLNPKQRMDAVLAGHFDAYISVHVQTTEEKTTDKKEMDVFITRFNNNTNFARSRLLGSSIIKKLELNFDIDHSLQQRKEKGIYVIDANPFPAILIECGFMNSVTSIKQLTDDSKELQIAKGILQGVVAYANADKNDSVSASIKDDSLPDVSLSIDTSGKKTPLYLVDGKETSVADAQKINANTIQSVNVIKGDEAAIKKYGTKAVNGVVLIMLKAHTSSEWKDAADDKTLQSPLTIKTSVDSLLIVVDGKTVDSKELYLMSPNDIESISVLGDDMAIKEYGEKGSKGVIEIKLKKVKFTKRDSSAVNNIKNGHEPE